MDGNSQSEMTLIGGMVNPGEWGRFPANEMIVAFRKEWSMRLRDELGNIPQLLGFLVLACVRINL